MQLLTLGINHHTAPIEVRERVAFGPEILSSALHDFRSYIGSKAPLHFTEATILSTCNRTEIYCACNENPHIDSIKNASIQWLSGTQGISQDILQPHIYSLPQSEAVRRFRR